MCLRLISVTKPRHVFYNYGLGTQHMRRLRHGQNNKPITSWTKRVTRKMSLSHCCQNESLPLQAKRAVAQGCLPHGQKGSLHRGQQICSHGGHKELFVSQTKKKKKRQKKRKFASCTKKVLASRTKRASKIMWDAGVRTEQKSILKKEKEKAKHVHRDLP